MNLKSLVAVVACFASSAALAQEQLVLVPMLDDLSGCHVLDGRKLARMRINLDGTTSVEQNEYVIPAGYVFEITDFQYGMQSYVRSTATVELSVSRRGVPGTRFVLFRGDAAPLRIFALGSNHTEPEQTGWGQVGAGTVHQNFNTPFRFSGSAQLCVIPWPRWGLSFAMVIGRLVPYTAPPPPSTPTLNTLK